MNEPTPWRTSLNRLAEAVVNVGGADALVEGSNRIPIRPATDNDAQHAELGDIAYTSTRVVSMSREVLARNRVVTALERGPVSDSYKILAIQVVQHLRERDANAIAVISPGEGEGKTLTAVNLAISLAGEVDHTVLLVDGDLRSPSVHRHLGFEPDAGLSDHLLSNLPLHHVLVNPGIPRMVLLPGGRPIVNSVEMLGSHKMRQLVDELKGRYASRLIVFDLPPVLSAADALAFAPYVDAAVMVVEESRTGRDDILRTLQMMSSVEVIGTVLNKSVQPAKSERSVGWWPWLLNRDKMRRA